MKAFFCLLFLCNYILAADFGLSRNDKVYLVEVPPWNADTKWHDQEQGIRNLEEFNIGNHGHVESVVNYLGTIAHGGVYTISNAARQLKAKHNGVINSKLYDDTPIGKNNSPGLVVLFHGLNGDPTLWDDHADYLSSYTGFDVIAPEIPERGNSDMQGAAYKKFLDRLVDWTKRNPSMPIAFFGQSNGTLVSTLYEVWLRDAAPQTPVYVSLSAPLLYGSEMVNKFKPILNFFAEILFEFNVFPVLNYGSAHMKSLLSSVREPLKDGVAKRHYEMFAPWHDHLVYSLGSALPVINPHKEKLKKERHFIVYNYGHNAIADGIMAPRISKCITWMHKTAMGDKAMSKEQKFYREKRKDYAEFVGKQRPSWDSQPIDRFIYANGIFKDSRGWLATGTQAFDALGQGICDVLEKKNADPIPELSGQLDFGKSAGLIVMLHGLNDSPVQWGSAYRAVKDVENGYFKNYTVYIPTLPARGNSDIKTISQPVGEMISKFYLTEGNQEKPVILIGTSNGGRLVLDLSNKFYFIKNLLMASVAGAFGSEVLSLANHVGLSFMTASPDIQNDLAFGSDFIKKTIDAAQRLHINKPHHAFLFFSSYSDVVIPSLEYYPSHPIIKIDKQTASTDGPQVKHIHVASVGHLSIPKGVYRQIFVDAKKWIESGFNKLDREANDLDCTLIDTKLEPIYY